MEKFVNSKALSLDVVVDENGKVVRTVIDGLTKYPYRKKDDGWDICSGDYTPSYLAKLISEDKAKWS